MYNFIIAKDSALKTIDKLLDQVKANIPQDNGTCVVVTEFAKCSDESLSGIPAKSSTSVAQPSATQGQYLCINKHTNSY